jgi:methyl-accepting chemotaxis protein
MKFRTQLMLANGLVLTLMLIIAAALYNSVNSLIYAAKWVSHTHEVMERGNTLMKLMVDMETGERGFLLVGKEEYLEPYQQGRKAFEEVMTDVKNLVSDNPQQVRRLEKINAMAHEWHEKAAGIEIELRRKMNNAGRDSTVSMKTIIDLLEKDTGKRIMDQIRNDIDEFVNIERTLMLGRSKENEETANNAIYTAIFGTLLALILGIIAVVVLTRSLMKQLGGEPSVVANMANRIAKGDLTISFDENDKKVGLYGSCRIWCTT